MTFFLHIFKNYRFENIFQSLSAFGAALGQLLDNFVFLINKNMSYSDFHQDEDKSTTAMQCFNRCTPLFTIKRRNLRFVSYSVRITPFA
jgi:hypothetical protein